MSGRRPRIGWLGFHQEGLPALRRLLAEGAPLACVITLTEAAAAKRSGAVDFTDLCAKHKIPLHRVEDINDPSSVDLLRQLDLDLLFVIGWSQIVRRDAMAALRTGPIGAHASLLPKNRGSAPINWSLIKGERETGNSLIWLTEDVDDGDLIDQVAFPISDYDTCDSLYAKVAESNEQMILHVLPKLLAGGRPGTPQKHTGEPVLPRRRPADGLIDWNQPARRVYDFIRALTRPYPGAFSFLDGAAKVLVWRAALPPLDAVQLDVPGTVLGKVVSPEAAACGQLVACASGALLLLEAEYEGGATLQGAALAEQAWQGKVLGRGSA